MGKKDDKVEAVLHLLRKQSPLTLKQEKFCNRECVERFLKGKGENVKKAAKQLISCLSWRQNIDIERLGGEEFSSELADGAAYIAGHAGESRPVIVKVDLQIFRFKHDYQKLHIQKQFTRLVAFTMETAISSMTRNAAQSVVILFDASFFRSSSAFANLLLATLKIIADYYPCRLYNAFIIDPPSFFSYIWKGVRPFVELSTVTMLVSSLDYDEQPNISHVSSSCPRSASLRFDASSIKSTTTIGSASSRFAFTVSQNSLKPWYLSFTNTSPFHGATVSSSAYQASPISARSLSFASPAARGLRDARAAPCGKSLFPSTPLPEKTKTMAYQKTPRPSFFQSPAMFFRGGKNVGVGGEKSREAFVPYLKFYRRLYDETAYRSKLKGPRGFVSVVSSHKRCRHVSLSQRF